MIATYYRLTKPGIIYGNLFTVLAGFLFASRLDFRPLLLLALMAGMVLVIAGACVINNVIDRDIDALMERTKNRALVTGTIGVSSALLFAATLEMAGFLVLGFHTNLLTACVACVGVVFYALIYTYAKRVTRLHTLIGSISGAVPILAGYTAYVGQIDTAGIVLFFIMVLWQMPHFYAIALFHAKEYAAAQIPLLPSIKGAYLTKIVVVAYIVAFMYAELLLTVLGYTGYIYCVLVLLVGVLWLGKALSGFSRREDSDWGKRVFFFSLTVLLVFCAAISFGALVP